MRDVGFRNADPRIPDREFRLSGRIDCRLNNDAAAFRGEFEGIGQEIEQNLAQPHLVRHYDRETRHRFDHDVEIAGLHRRGSNANSVLDHGGHVDLVLIHDNVSGLDLRKIENILDQFQQMHAAGMNILAVFMVLGVFHRPEYLVPKDFRISDHRV